MKKICFIFLCMVVALCITSCKISNVKKTETDMKTKATDITEQNDINTLTKNDNAQNTLLLFNDEVDLDLTKLPQPDAYEAMYGVLHLPSEYKEKIIKMNGECHIYYDTESKTPHYTCALPETILYKTQEIAVVFDNKFYDALSELPKDGEFITIIGKVDICNYNNSLDSAVCDAHWIQYDNTQTTE